MYEWITITMSFCSCFPSRLLFFALNPETQALYFSTMGPDLEERSVLLNSYYVGYDHGCQEGIDADGELLEEGGDCIGEDGDSYYEYFEEVF